MLYTLFAATDAEATGLGALGVNLQAFLTQLVTFLILFFILKRFAFKPIIRLLDQRHQTIDNGVRLGLKLEREREKQQAEAAKVMRDARAEADRIIATANKEAREVMRDAEKAAQRKVDAMFNDAEARIHEEMEQARRGLEKEIVGLVSEATEAIVEEKVDPKKDAKLIDKTLKGRKRS